jgi:[acyl-carrier-protein] S-malonyltransferase
VYECGPGKVLAGMSRRIEATLQGAAIADAAGLEEILNATGAA